VRTTLVFAALALASTAVAGAGSRTHDRTVFDTFVAFARHPSNATWSHVAFGDRVALGLANRVLVDRTAGELRDPRTWRLETAGFRGRSGPFSAIGLIAGERRPLTMTVGRHRRCASPAGPAPPRVASRRRISVQPRRVESCLQWWSVDLFLTRDGHVRAVTLDLWEP
jgi:hypothetical protein